MKACVNHQEMKNYAKYIESAGFIVRAMKDGTLEVQDPYHLNGKANAGFDLVKISTPRQAIRFINERSWAT